jgi:hypothetical protein
LKSVSRLRGKPVRSSRLKRSSRQRSRGRQLSNTVDGISKLKTRRQTRSDLRLYSGGSGRLWYRKRQSCSSYGGRRPKSGDSGT